MPRVASSSELILSNCGYRCCFSTFHKLFFGVHSLTKTNIKQSIQGELNTYPGRSEDGLKFGDALARAVANRAARELGWGMGEAIRAADLRIENSGAWRSSRGRRGSFWRDAKRAEEVLKT